MMMAEWDRRCETLLDAMMQINVANDCFYIWHWGPFATMNGLKLGRLPSFYPVRSPSVSLICLSPL